METNKNWFQKLIYEHYNLYLLKKVKESFIPSSLILILNHKNQIILFSEVISIIMFLKNLIFKLK